MMSALDKMINDYLNDKPRDRRLGLKAKDELEALRANHDHWMTIANKLMPVKNASLKLWNAWQELGLALEDATKQK